MSKEFTLFQPKMIVCYVRALIHSSQNGNFCDNPPESALGREVAHPYRGQSNWSPSAITISPAINSHSALRVRPREPSTAASAQAPAPQA